MLYETKSTGEFSEIRNNFFTKAEIADIGILELRNEASKSFWNFFLLGAIFFLVLSKAPLLQVKLVHFFIERSDLFLFLGMVALGFGAVLFLCFYSMNKKVCYQLRMKGVSVSSLVLRGSHRFSPPWWRSRSSPSSFMRV